MKVHPRNSERFGKPCNRGGITYNPYDLVLRVKLTGPNFYHGLSCCECLWTVLEIYRGHLHPDNVALQWENIDLGVRLDHLDGVLKTDWAITFNLKLLVVSFADNASDSHVNKVWKKLWLF